METTRKVLDHLNSEESRAYARDFATGAVGLFLIIGTFYIAISLLTLIADWFGGLVALLVFVIVAAGMGYANMMKENRG